MILLLGQSGYIGSAFRTEMERRTIKSLCLSRTDCDYTDHDLFQRLLFVHRPELVINCAAFIPKPSVAMCDDHASETITGNLELPVMLAATCKRMSIPMAHISTGCLWSDGMEHSEDDPVQRAFNGHCGFYVGVKSLAEKLIDRTQNYIWRVRLPFDQFDNERNYLSKLMLYKQVFNQINSVSHRGDFVKACLDLWELRAPFGIYNVMNQGALSTPDAIQRMAHCGLIKIRPAIVHNREGECRLSVKKLLNAGVSIRSADEAFCDSIQNWVPCTKHTHTAAPATQPT